MNQALELGRKQLYQCDCLMITLGTAQVFYHKASGKGVANCHKLPGQDFEKKRLQPESIQALFEPLFEQLEQILPNLKIILSVIFHKRLNILS